MKANELQIGDWVYYTTPKNPTPVRIGRIYVNEERGMREANFYGNLGNDSLSESSFAPIPLTPEILEKNFEKTRGVENHYGLSDDYFEVVISEVTDSIWQVEYANCEAHFPVCRNLVCHVHQLQNCLRLVGIDKQIVL